MNRKLLLFVAVILTSPAVVNATVLSVTPRFTGYMLGGLPYARGEATGRADSVSPEDYNHLLLVSVEVYRSSSSTQCGYTDTYTYLTNGSGAVTITRSGQTNLVQTQSPNPVTQCKMHRVMGAVSIIGSCTRGEQVFTCGSVPACME